MVLQDRAKKDSLFTSTWKQPLQFFPSFFLLGISSLETTEYCFCLIFVSEEEKSANRTKNVPSSFSCLSSSEMPSVCHDAKLFTWFWAWTQVFMFVSQAFDQLSCHPGPDTGRFCSDPASRWSEHLSLTLFCSNYRCDIRMVISYFFLNLLIGIHLEWKPIGLSDGCEGCLWLSTLHSQELPW